MFHPLRHIKPEDLPTQFTYPFHYKAHPICQEAASLLQEQLNEWQWDKENLGKMFGVLLVQKQNDEIGYLWAYSGNLSAALNPAVFVPPIFNLLDENSFFIEGEKELNRINKKVSALSDSPQYLQLKMRLETTEHQRAQAIDRLKDEHNEAKNERKKQRKIGRAQLSKEDFELLTYKLNRESQNHSAQSKRLRQEWDKKVIEAEKELDILKERIVELKTLAQNKSSELQQRLFDQYQLLNAKHEEQSLISIFKAFSEKMPPAAAGDCAAPRLLQYAYKNKLKPLAMAEFWWGKSPKSIIRTEGHYYPACKSKCEPILSHMLQGLDVEENPLLSQAFNSHLDVVYEDDVLIVVNKPAGMLSVKGKTKLKSLSDYLLEQKPELNKLFIVHRLDMATSGLILLAKNEKIYKKLQEQFLNRSVKKRYEAILDGKIEGNEGKINLPLRVDLDNRPQQMVCETYGKPALTIWRKLEEKNGKTRVAFYPQTGRTHQLRVHAAHPLGLNTPIVGDDLYGHTAERLHLHAASLSFTHPISQKRIIAKANVQF